MLRDKSLIPLSRQHQHALALCVRIDRAPAISHADLPAWQAEIRQQFQSEIRVHFAAEESVVFPAAKRFPELAELVEDLCGDHAQLRESFARAELGTMTADELGQFAKRLSEHIRKEERGLFEGMQRLMTTEDFVALETRLNDALKDAAQVCALPNGATGLK